MSTDIHTKKNPTHDGIDDATTIGADNDNNNAKDYMDAAAWTICQLIGKSIARETFSPANQNDNKTGKRPSNSEISL